MTATLAPAAVQAIIHRSVPIAGTWAIEVLHAADGAATVRLPRDPVLLRPGGTVSGPALMGLADVALWAAVLGVTGGHDESVTSTMTVNFLRAIGPGPAIAEARIVKRGRRLMYGEVLIRAEGREELCVHVTTTWAIIAPAGAGA